MFNSAATPIAINQIYDINQTFSNDILTSGTGNLSAVTGSELTNQRILRRLLTRKLGYVWHADYGAGLPQYVGENLSSDTFDEIRATILAQIFLEDSVSKIPEPEILLQTISGDLYCQINYMLRQTNTPVVLTFSVNAYAITN